MSARLLKETVTEEILTICVCMSQFFVKIKIQVNKQEVRFTIILLFLMGS